MMLSLFQILMMILGIAKMFIFAHFIMSWLISFDILNLRQQIVAQIWHGLQRLLDPIYQPMRRILPPMGGLDLAPMAALILILVLETILRNNAQAFY